MSPDTRSIVWTVPTSHYYDWPEEERQRIIEFLAAHDIDHKRVPVGNGTELTVYVDDATGALMLHTWLHVRGDRGLERCPTCPACAMCEEVTVALRAETPAVFGSLRPREILAEAEAHHVDGNVLVLHPDCTGDPCTCGQEPSDG